MCIRDRHHRDGGRDGRQGAQRQGEEQAGTAWAAGRLRGAGRLGGGAWGGEPAVAQEGEEFAGGGAGLGALLQAEADEGKQFVRHSAEFRVAVDDPYGRFVGGRAVERAAAGGGVRDDRAEGEDVGGRAHVVG